MGRVTALQKEGTNLVLELEAPLDEAVKVDQSIAHNGVCLTVTALLPVEGAGQVGYRVVAVEETLKKTNLGSLAQGDRVNLERCLKVGQRLDGHFVQGHVDTVGEVVQIEVRAGSWNYHFRFPEEYANLLVDKGSVCVNGVSLTVVEARGDRFWVTIIPYTHAHTNFHALRVGSPVNLEFDILGKYLLKAYGKGAASNPRS